MDTIIRVRRKRGAEPAEALVLTPKKTRTDDGDGPQRVMFSLWKNALPAAVAPDTVEENHRLIDWELGGSGSKETEAVAAVEVSSGEREGNENEELSFVSDDAIGEIGEVEKPLRKMDDDVILCNGAPLLPAAAAAQTECDDVFDFYRVAHPNGELVFEDEEEKEWEIAVATKQEMLAYIGAMDGVDVESEPDSEDSNDENNWRNDYPDESSDDDEDAEDDEFGRRRRRAGQYGDEEYGSSDDGGFRYGGEDTDDDGDDELAEGWRNFRIG